jgi:uncharacterized damage-inducible protein DinB
MTNSEAATIRQYVGLPLLKAEHPITQAVIGAIPPGKGDYRPDDVVKSALDLAWHIVTAEVRFVDAAVSGQFNLTPLPRPAAVGTGDEVNRWYEEQFTRAIAGLASAPVDALVKVVDFRGIFQLPAVAYVQLGVCHSIHHRGQLSMYLRPMGAKVPSIYGESYDARMAREAAARA